MRKTKYSNSFRVTFSILLLLMSVIVEVQKKRDAAVKEAEGAGGPKDAFDAEVVAKLKERAAKVGIAY